MDTKQVIKTGTPLSTNHELRPSSLRHVSNKQNGALSNSLNGINAVAPSNQRPGNNVIGSADIKRHNSNNFS